MCIYIHTSDASLRKHRAANGMGLHTNRVRDRPLRDPSGVGCSFRVNNTIRFWQSARGTSTGDRINYCRAQCPGTEFGNKLRRPRRKHTFSRPRVARSAVRFVLSNLRFFFSVALYVLYVKTLCLGYCS